MTHRVGIIGLGIMGRRMLQRMEEHGGFRVVAGWDPSPEAAGPARELSPALAIESGAEALCRRDDVDLVHVAAPPSAHRALVEMALGAGKAVLCEKPLAVSVKDGVAMAALAQAPGARLAVNYVLATAPAVTELARVLADGEVGAAAGAALSVGFREWPRPWQKAAGGWLAGRAEGGFTREVLSHFLFVLRRLLGPLEVVESRVGWPDDPRLAERELFATLMAGGKQVHVSGHVGRIPADDRNELVVTAERGALRLYDWRQLERADRGGWVPVRVPKEPGGPGSAQLDAIVAWLDGQPQVLASVAEALDVQRCVEELLDFQP